MSQSSGAVQSASEITVVLPAWDAYVGHYLDDALGSLLSQDLASRIIVVDNFSRVSITPRSGVEIVRTPRRLTVGAARNYGLAYADTPYVLFWDADDVMLPGTLSTLRRSLDADADAVAVTTKIYETANRVHHWPRRSSWRLARVRWPFAVTQIVSSLFPTTGSVLLRTKIVRDAGGFEDCDGGDDWALGASLAFRGRVKYLGHPGRLYRLHTGSLSAGWRAIPDRVTHARIVRRRIRRDRTVPKSVRLILPLLGALQLLVIFVVRPLRNKRPLSRVRNSVLRPRLRRP